MSYQILSGNPNTEVSVVVILEGEKMKRVIGRRPERGPDVKTVLSECEGLIPSIATMLSDEDVDICDSCNDQCDDCPCA